MNLYAIMSLALAIYFLIVFFVTTLFGLEGSDLWILRGLLALIGILGTVAYLVYYFQSLRPGSWGRKKDEGGGGAPGSRRDGGEVDAAIKEAEARLASSELGKAKTANLPLLLILGREGSAKTSALVRGGLDPELLSGQVFQADTVVPTGGVNVWYAQRCLFVEAGGKLPARPDQWRRLLKRLRPGGLSSVFGGGQDAPRAALVCVSCEEFLQPGASEALAASARELRTKLEEASQEFGVRLPVYVLFTKADRIAFFAEYTRNLAESEIGQVVGVTLPPADGDAHRVYAERQSEQLTRSFSNLIYSLSDRRTDFLPREEDDAARAGIYEFPRELSKLRTNLVQFLVDLCRPSQLQAGPFLRGYYFSGVRAVMVKEMPVQRATAERGGEVSRATGVFSAEQVRQAAAAQGPVVRKKPQWVFLSHLFRDVLLPEALAPGAGGASAKTNRLRRWLLATATALCFIWTIGMIVSFFGNRRLASEVSHAVRGIGSGEAAGGELASVEALTRLDTVRHSLERLTRYETEGPPIRLRWGLYCGDELYPEVRRAYYSRFRQLLFGNTQAAMLAALRRLPEKPSPGDEYSPAYDTLKGYLITTSHPGKSTREFLTPVLMRYWTAARDVDAPRADLARLQFGFYAGDLPNGNPYTAENDGAAIGRARSYLLQFTGAEPIYQFMLAEASRQNPPVNFNRMFPGSEAVVVNHRDVPGAFTAKGWAFIEDALKNVGRFFGGEEWVLGRQPSVGGDTAGLAETLGARYRRDFINAWRQYLADTQVVRYRSLGDAAEKLARVSGNQSPLLAALWLASRNTAVGNEDVKKIFQPVQFVTPPGNQDRLIGEANSRYMESLLGLQAAVEQASNAPPATRDPQVEQVNSQAAQAKVVTRQVAQNFTIHPDAKVDAAVQELMEKPILYAESLVRALGPAELNAKGQALCAQFAGLMRKYPFQQTATVEAAPAEIAAIFRPGGGSLWVFYEEDLRELLPRQGDRYATNPASKIRLNEAFVAFFNRAAAFAEAIYPQGSGEPRLTYKLTGYPAEGIQGLVFSVDDQSLSVSGQPASQMFVWPGDGDQKVTLSAQVGGTSLGLGAYGGLWAVFRFFAEMDRWETAGNTSQMQQIPRIGGRSGQPVTVSGGRPLTLRFTLEASAPVFNKDFLAGLRCVSTVAR